MAIKKLDLAALDAWVNRLIADQKVIGVQANNDKFDFAPLEQAEDLRLDYDVTYMPPKVFFQPPSETLVRFEGNRYESVPKGDPFVLLGIHPYDMVALNQMDRIWTKDNVDTHYTDRRNAATVVACDVQTPSENVFAGCMGAAVVKDGFDVLLTRIGDHYLVDAATEKGEAICASLEGEPDAEGKDIAARAEIWRANNRLLRKHELQMFPSDLPHLLEKKHDHPVWEEMAEKCFSCGSCTNCCPTCYCFDVQDEVKWDLESGERQRSWDSCQLRGFAEVAGGHNFRQDVADRYRHRYYRKGKYVPEMIGECACVGCGRCISACVAKIAHPVTVYNRLLEEK